ncbi:probable disease resistance protein At5g47260 [Ziziphus jujuba]|uniref:Probable disease resistance protein At5g47260 n=1 Tax=Ziziphus jujuba TaxID=326968 RepID=A0ABM4AFS2_ZIZJJ|nr:probable disease resistance protein At5g47260 [Ziziphus jujuba]
MVGVHGMLGADVEQILKAIAERADLKLDKETILEKALLLKNRFKLEKKFLIIVDDISNELKLEDVGIVFKSDEKVCKILFTSTFERVLSTKMGVDKLFQVGLSEEAEALNWFNHLVAKSLEKDS